MYGVEWTDAAVNRLTLIWMAADAALRKRLTRISGNLDADLSYNPKSYGESRDGMMRVVFHPPLTVYYTVDEKDKIDTVIQVVFRTET